jgi:hypothetical protein
MGIGPFINLTRPPIIGREDLIVGGRRLFLLDFDGRRNLTKRIAMREANKIRSQFWFSVRSMVDQIRSNLNSKRKGELKATKNKLIWKQIIGKLHLHTHK